MAGLSNDQIEILNNFIQESRDMIEQLEPTIIELEQKKDDPEVINSIFRLFHSIKGGAGFLNMENIVRASHAAENLLDLIRSGEIPLHSTHIDLLCKTCDLLKDGMDYMETNLKDDGIADEASALASKLGEALKEAAASSEGDNKGKQKNGQGVESENKEADKREIPIDHKLKITPELLQRFVQEQGELLQDFEQGLLKWINLPQDIIIVEYLFRTIHSFKGNCGFYEYSQLERLSHNIETVLEPARSGINMGTEELPETLLKILDTLRETISDISLGGSGAIKGLNIYIELLKKMIPKGWAAPDDSESRNRLGNILVEDGDITAVDLESGLKIQGRPIGEILIDMGATTLQKVESALDKQKEISAAAKPKSVPEKGKETTIKRQDIRVNLDKLDNLINLIGEMVIAENMLTHNPDLEGLEIENFSRAAQQMNKIVRELQEVAMNIRMIPISGLFRRMIRLVHDLAGKSGKKVELRLAGEETEVDKTVIETITDPLVHLIRNSLDHGLEIPEERRKAEKAETGVVNLSARHEEGEVWITIEDDGRGLDREKILSKAITKGLIEDNGLQMSDKAVFGLIFTPGFSTVDEVTDISGRGVGMDVVKRNLEKIKGKIEVHSKQGAGTKIILRIPLTLAIIDGMMVRVGDSKYIIPTLAIKESLRPDPQAITVSPDGQELVRIREELIPVVRLHEIYKKNPDHRELHEGILIILEIQDMNISLFVDEIQGQQQTVIKGLSSFIGNIRGVSGCTILGNGDVCLIIDVRNLIETMNRTQGEING